VSTGDASYASALEGKVSGKGRRFLIVASRFNSHVTEPLLESAIACLDEHGAARASIEVVRVPGAWEIPQAIAWRLDRVAQPGVSAVIAIGCLIRGETYHFEAIADEVARGLGAVARSSGTPVIFGVLTTENETQALERADPARGNKGREAALAALEMAALYAGRLVT
jgi:6,7-dimethyl-8-ribityllumazine synthase